MAAMRAWISLFLSILSMRARSTLRILPRMGRIAWVGGLRAWVDDPPAESPSTMNSSASSADVPRCAVPQLARACRPPRGPTCAGWHPGPGGPPPGPGRGLMDLVTICRASVGFSSSHSASFSLVARSTSERMGTLPSLALVWPSNCGSRSLTDDDGGQALPDVLTEQVLVLLLEQVSAPGVLVDHRGEGLPEALDVGAALDGGDAVGEAVDALVVAGVPLQGHLDLAVVLGHRCSTPTFLNRASLEALRWRTKSMMPPAYL